MFSGSPPFYPPHIFGGSLTHITHWCLHSCIHIPRYFRAFPICILRCFLCFPLAFPSLLSGIFSILSPYVVWVFFNHVQCCLEFFFNLFPLRWLCFPPLLLPSVVSFSLGLIPHRCLGSSSCLLMLSEWLLGACNPMNPPFSSIISPSVVSVFLTCVPHFPNYTKHEADHW